MKTMSEEIPASLDVSLSRLIMDRKSLRISGKTDTFNTVEAVKDRLAGSGRFRSAAISSANLDRDGGKVLFEITLDPGSPPKLRDANGYVSGEAGRLNR